MTQVNRGRVLSALVGTGLMTAGCLAGRSPTPTRPGAAPTVAPASSAAAAGPVAAALAPRETSLRQTSAASLLSAALHAEVSEQAPALRYLSELDRVAEAAAWSAATDGVVSEAAVRTAMVGALRSGVSPHVLTAWVVAGSAELHSTSEEADPAKLSSSVLPMLHDTLSAALRELVLVAPLDGYGVAVRRGPAGLVAALVALPPPRLPLRVERRGQRAVVTTPWHHLAEPAAFVVTPRQSRRLAPRRVGDEVRVEVSCRGGQLDLEVTGAGGMVASVVDVCNQAEPRWDAATGDIGPPALTLVEIEQRSFELVNRERRRLGLPALAWSATAQMMARWHAEDLARHELVSHVGSDGNTLEQRVARAALPAWRTFENVGRAGGPGQMHLGFMTSPGHRENLLEPSTREGGVGAAFSARGELYVTQVFVQPPQPQLRVLGQR